MASGGRSSPLYDTTFTLYRLSPLHFASTTPLLSNTALRIHARRLQNNLAGDVLRGVRVGLIGKDEGLASAGSLKACGWELLQHELDIDADNDGANEGGGMMALAGVRITEGISVGVEYEHATYTAFLLREAHRARNDPQGELHLPLLLTRMPSAVRESVFDYLATTFDTRIEPMHFSSDLIGDALDGFLEEMQKCGQRTMQAIVKDVRLSLGFKAPITPSLRNLDITIRRDDIPDFLKKGQAQVAKAGGSTISQANAENRATGHKPGPFIAAVGQYLDTQLALSLSHEDVVVSRIACGAFALGREGKLKIFSPTNPTDEAEDQQDTARLVQGAISRLIKQLFAQSEDIL